LYNWGGYCKHTGAVLLKWMQSPGRFCANAAKPAPALTADYPIDVVPVEPPVTYRPKNPPAWLTSSMADRRQAEEKQLLRLAGNGEKCKIYARWQKNGAGP
jgi:hypothetical protein